MKGRYLGNFKDMNDVSDNFDFNGYHEEGDYITISKKIYIYDNISKSFSEICEEANDDKNKDKIIFKCALNNLDELNQLNKEDLKEGDSYIVMNYKYNLFIYRESINDFEKLYLPIIDSYDNNSIYDDNIEKYNLQPMYISVPEENNNHIFMFLIAILLIMVAQLSYIILHI